MVANEQGNWPELAQAAEGVELLGVLAPGLMRS